MSDGCHSHNTCSGCCDIEWGFDRCPNLARKSEEADAYDAALAGGTYRARSGQAAITRDERVKRGRAFRKARKPHKEAPHA